MTLKPWEELPQQLRQDCVWPYYQALSRRRGALAAKRLFDLVGAAALLVLLSPVLLAVAVAVRLDSPGEVIFRQARATQYARPFYIYKFRTMVVDAQRLGSQVTTKGDSRVTRVGRFLRRYRLDELPQLLNILKGEMSFVGTRPEVLKYVEQYTGEMWATLLLPAGVTSTASIRYKDEERLLTASQHVDRTYLEEVLPQKMAYNLEYLKCYSFWLDWKILWETLLAVFG